MSKRTDTSTPSLFEPINHPIPESSKSTGYAAPKSLIDAKTFTCACPQTDGYRCAVESGLPGVDACPCACHPFIAEYENYQEQPADEVRPRALAGVDYGSDDKTATVEIEQPADGTYSIINAEAHGTNCFCPVCMPMESDGNDGHPLDTPGQPLHDPLAHLPVFERDNPLELKAREWINANTEVMSYIERFVLSRMRARKITTIAYVWEHVRCNYVYYVKQNEQGAREPFRMSNNHKAYVSRYLIYKHPELAQYLLTKQTKAERGEEYA